MMVGDVEAEDEEEEGFEEGGDEARVDCICVWEKTEDPLDDAKDRDDDREREGDGDDGKMNPWE